MGKCPGRSRELPSHTFFPHDRIHALFPRSRMSSTRCVTIIQGIIISVTTARVRSLTALVLSTSSAVNGSSSIRIFGRMAIARARATLCFCPPERSFAFTRERSRIPIFPSRDATRDSMTSAFSCRARRPKAIFSRTVKWGKTAEFWKTYPTHRSSGGKSVPAAESKRVSPPSRT